MYCTKKIPSLWTSEQCFFTLLHLFRHRVLETLLPGKNLRAFISGLRMLIKDSKKSICKSFFESVFLESVSKALQKYYYWFILESFRILVPDWVVIATSWVLPRESLSFSIHLRKQIPVIMLGTMQKHDCKY